jgi:Tfp pilus assembly protein PilO
MSINLRNPKTLLLLALGGTVVLSAALWLLLVSPERKKSTSLDDDIAAVQQKIDERTAALATPKASIHVKATDLYKLNRAMPNSIDMPGIILTLNQLATQHHLDFSSIQPNPTVTQTGFTVQPAAISLQGRFSDVSAFLGAVRRLVDVRKHQLKATGRLFTVDSVQFGKADDQRDFPNVKATLTIDAFMFSGGALVPPAQTTPSASSGTVAAGANP